MRNIYITVALVAFFVCLAWLLWGVFATEAAKWALAGAEAEEAGVWGDSYGAFNAGFSALGFSAVLGALLVQARALRLQQQDAHRQQFDNSFFALLDLMRDLREKIRFRHSLDYIVQKRGDAEGSSRSSKYGLEAVTAAAREIRFWIGRHKKNKGEVDRNAIAEIYYGYIHKRHENRIAAYFRIVILTLERIRNDTILKQSEKESYVNILRGVLTSYELGLIAINGLMAAEEEMNQILTESRLLKNMSDGLLRRTLEKFYPPEAFDNHLVSTENTAMIESEDDIEGS